MRHATAFTFAALTVGFWALVYWVADAFRPLELVSVIGLTTLVAGGWLWWEVEHAVPHPDEPDEFYVPDDWLWPPNEDQPKVVVSSWRREGPRHGGLGR